MSFSKIDDFSTIAAIQAGKGIGGSDKNVVRNAQLQEAFSNQMNMAQGLLDRKSVV